MFLTALRDLQWRRRRVVIAAAGTALVFAVTLLLTGLANGFDVETRTTVSHFRADAWVVRQGSAGPYLGQSPMPQSVVDSVRQTPGVREANPMVFGRKTEGASQTEINVFGASGRGPAIPIVDEGRGPRSPGEIVISTRLHHGVGDHIVVAGRTFTVVGRIHGWTALAGVGNAWVTLPDGQDIVYAGRPLVSSVAIRGRALGSPPGTQVMTNAQARNDLLRPVKNPKRVIQLFSLLNWLVAATIIGSVIYLSALERVRDFAVFKATGTSNAKILGDLMAQAVLLSIVAACISAGVAVVLSSRFAMPVVIPGLAFALLPVIAVAVGLLASLGGIRRAVTVDPALAFASA